jgi:hypothetical protein
MDAQSQKSYKPNQHTISSDVTVAKRDFKNGDLKNHDFSQCISSQSQKSYKPNQHTISSDVTVAKA